jgi:microcystin-dependent protein
MGSYFRDFYSPTATQRPTVGDTKFSVINQDHMGWMKCDGRALSKATYNILYQVVGDAFGSTATSFYLPNAEGRVPGAVGMNTDVIGRETTHHLGDLSGEEVHLLNIREMPAHKHGSVDVTQNNNGDGFTSLNAAGITANPHTHTYSLVNDTATVSGGAVGVECYDSVNTNATTGSTTVTLNDPTHRHTIGSTGGGAVHNNMQPTIFIGNMFIFSGKVRPSATNYYPYTPRGPIF